MRSRSIATNFISPGARSPTLATATKPSSMRLSAALSHPRIKHPSRGLDPRVHVFTGSAEQDVDAHGSGPWAEGPRVKPGQGAESKRLRGELELEHFRGVRRGDLLQVG